MPSCPSCESKNVVKNGFIHNGNQIEGTVLNIFRPVRLTPPSAAITSLKAIVVSGCPIQATLRPLAKIQRLRTEPTLFAGELLRSARPSNLILQCCGELDNLAAPCCNQFSALMP